MSGIDERIRSLFQKIKENIVIITNSAIWFTITALFAISVGMMSKHKYPGLAAYAMMVSFVMFMIEVGISMMERVEISDQPLFSMIKEKLLAVRDFFTPIKKCVLYALFSFPLFIHTTVCVPGGLLLILCAVLLAAQVKYEDTSSSEGYFMAGDDEEMCSPPPRLGSGSPPEREDSPRSEQGWNFVADDEPLILEA